MSVLLKAPPKCLQRYDVYWDKSFKADHSSCCPLRNISQVSECAWVCSNIMPEDHEAMHDDGFAPLDIPMSAKRRLKFRYCIWKERLVQLRHSKSPGHRSSFGEKIHHAIAGFSHGSVFLGSGPTPVY
eukprot:Protomagalhaensia_wolfi_Nauph_80__3170@NODE_3227_length_851_cov_1350_230296_g2526_i0_p1_GENE_NODE_3227_length_851_cov_1350_230296_g2526_i0NODE_3227_length_851_cov_1350_230296_g2526_i0_p1_ORF_typecomplete_len128_score11_81_NODE_3227_length_851_cov_1350_230296_g2526_i095478